MLTLYEQCDAIDADLSLTEPEKARRKAELKAVGIKDALNAAWTFPETWSVARNGHSYTITITAVTTRSVTGVDGLSRTFLTIAGAATRDGNVLNHPNGVAVFPIELCNPPVLIAGGGTVVRNNRSFTYDLVTLCQSVLADVVAGV